MPQPVDVVHRKRDHSLTITWDDGAVSVLPIHYLRGWCPCAACQGHQPVVRYREHPSDLGIAFMAEAGAYALHIRFSDGHDTGIYSWAWLRQIAPESAPRGLKRGAFSHGQFVADDASTAT